MAGMLTVEQDAANEPSETRFRAIASPIAPPKRFRHRHPQQAAVDQQASQEDHQQSEFEPGSTQTIPEKPQGAGISA